MLCPSSYTGNAYAFRDLRGLEMNRIQRHRASVFLSGLLCLSGAGALMAGCSSSPGTASPTDNASIASATAPAPPATPPSIPTPTPTPTPTYKPASAEGPAENVPLPVMPEEAKVESKEGLEAFARYWYDLVNYGYETGDVEPVKQVTGESAFAAASYYSALEDGYAGDDWMGGAEVSVISAISPYVRTPDGRFQVVITFEQESLEYYSSEGAVEVITPSVNPGKMLIEATYSDGGWRADEVVSLRE